MGFFKKKKNDPLPPPIRPRPSLPELTQSNQAIAWPSALVDENELRRESEGVGQDGVKSARKISFSQSRNVPFHKPFRPYASTGSGPRLGPENEPQSPYPPSAYNNNRVSGVSVTTLRSKSRRAKMAPTFNVMVVGGQQTGKTSFLRLLLETADVAPTASMDQRAEVESFLAHKPKATKEIKSLNVEIIASISERLLLTVIDTPGLEFSSGRELVLEQQTNSIIREIDKRYAETLIEENKVVRSSKGDQHVHLCIYLIDPSAIIEQRATPDMDESGAGSPGSPTEVSESESDYETVESLPSPSIPPRKKKSLSGFTLRKSELRVLRRLAAKTNVLPVIARSDSLTDERLQQVKNAVRADLETEGIGFGVFAIRSPESTPDKPSDLERGRQRMVSANASTRENERTGSDVGSPKPNGKTTKEAGPLLDSESDDSNDEEKAVPPNDGKSSIPVVRIRSTKTPSLTRHRSISRIRKAHVNANESDEEFDLARGRRSVEIELAENVERTLNEKKKNRMSYASIRFYDHTRQLMLRDLEQAGGGSVEPGAAQTEVDRLLPFAIVNPERRSTKKHIRQSSFEPSAEGSEEAHPPETSLFVRKFRWGTIDVLDPRHCDFVPLRTAIFFSHLKALKSATKEAYERYRTEKLLLQKARTSKRLDAEAAFLKANGNTNLPTGGSWVDVASGAKLFADENGVVTNRAVKQKSATVDGHISRVHSRPTTAQ